MGRAIKAGRVWTNCYHAYPARAFGGYKESGIGRETHKVMLTTTSRPRTCWSATARTSWASSDPSVVRVRQGVTGRGHSPLFLPHPRTRPWLIASPPPGGLQFIEELRAEFGPLMFLLSGGCCDGSVPNCYKVGEVLPGQTMILLGQVGGADFYRPSGIPVLREQPADLDVQPGNGGTSPLIAGAASASPRAPASSPMQSRPHSGPSTPLERM
jgi:uncharacterized protein (DUF779 family)